MLDSPLFLTVTGGVLALLTLFSGIGWIMARRVSSDTARATVRNLNARTKSWWVMVFVFAAALTFGPIVTLVLFAAISFMALREFVSLIPTRRGDHRALFLSFFLVVPAQYVLIGMDWYGMFSIVIPVYVFLALPALSAASGDTTQFLARNANVQWGLMLSVYAISHAPALLTLDITGFDAPPALLLLFLMLVVQMSDVFQYVVGKLIGRTKLAPSVSPSKTVEGLLGGGAIAVCIGAGLHGLTPFSPLEAAGMAAAIVISGFLGGLVLSAIKRDLGVKDWGTMIEGHGGMLDRMDSVAFAAPIFFHMTRYWFTP